MIFRNGYANTHTMLKLVMMAIIICSSLVAAEDQDQTGFSTLQGKPFLMAAPRRSETHLFKWWALIYSEVFRRAGVKLKMEYFPIKRASLEADIGNVDGEPARIRQYQNNHYNLVRIDEFVHTLQINAYATKIKTPLNGWQSLKGKKYYVEYLRGVEISEYNLTKVLDKKYLTDSSSAFHSLEKLLSNRIDLYIDSHNAISPLLKQVPFGGVIYPIGLMESVDLYFYIHRKHKQYIPKLTKIIQNMKEEGLIKQYRDKVYGLTNN